MPSHFSLTAWLSVASLVGASCSSPDSSSRHTQSSPSPAPSASASAGASRPADEEPPLPPTASPYDALPPGTRSLLDQPFTGDFDEMVKRRLIRAGVVYNRTQYFIDHGVQRGISYESLKLFEEEINKRLKTGLLKVHVAIVPLHRGQLATALTDGQVDLVAATITITPERQQIAAFSNPTRRNVSSVVVTGAHSPPVATPADLSGRMVFVRRSSVFYDDVVRLNEELTSRGKAPAMIRQAPEALEDDDLLEMVNAGLVEATVLDDFVAAFWSQVFPNVRVNEGAALRTGGEIGVAVRKNNPKLLQAINTWIDEYGPNTAFGNILDRRYLESPRFVKSAADEEERKKLQAVVKLFQTYGDRYKLDYLLMAAQGYQESGLNQSAKSAVGAVGVMQVMPATGKDLGVGDINKVDANIHAGVKYFRFMMDNFYKDEPMDDLNKGLMTLASYNAGPGRIRQLRAETAKRGLDPNVWFDNVERVTSERIGRETVTYVGNIYKYYVAYRLVTEQNRTRDQAKEESLKSR
jgi:membrane-bound lytic murein transglycosylase MltF